MEGRQLLKDMVHLILVLLDHLCLLYHPFFHVFQVVPKQITLDFKSYFIYMYFMVILLKGFTVYFNFNLILTASPFEPLSPLGPCNSDKRHIEKFALTDIIYYFKEI